MSDPFIAQIVMFAGNFAPRGWSFCDGQVLPIAQHTALFSLLGTTYGGDGRTTFALPDLRGRVPIHEGTGPGLSEHRLGSNGGSNHQTMTVNTMPSHNHTYSPQSNSDPGNNGDPDGNHPANTGGSLNYSNAKDDSAAQSTTAKVGNGQAFTVMAPGLGINYIIAMVGTYPSRN